MKVESGERRIMGGVQIHRTANQLTMLNDAKTEEKMGFSSFFTVFVLIKSHHGRQFDNMEAGVWTCEDAPTPRL